MSHVAEQILRAIETALVAADTAAQNRVFVDRVDPLQPTELPAILIEEAPQGERSEYATVGGLEQRDLTVRIAGVVAHRSQYGSLARDLALAIEKVLANPEPALDALARSRRITLSQIVLSGEGEAARGARQQYWLFSYYVQSGSPDVAV